VHLGALSARRLWGGYWEPRLGLGAGAGSRGWGSVNWGWGWGHRARWGWGWGHCGGSALADDFDGAYVALADAQDEEAAAQQVVRAGDRVL
jgi:hypothetical protein